MKHILVPIGSTENAQTTLQYAIDFACAVGAMVAQSAGATPVLTLEQITGFMQPV